MKAAFPRPASNDHRGVMVGSPQDGMNLREYYAGLAMQAMSQCAPWPNKRDSCEIARRAVLIADDLIAALNAPPDRDSHGPFT